MTKPTSALAQRVETEVCKRIEADGILEIEAAIALEGILGNDGNLTRAHFGNVLYGTTGNA